MRAAYVLECGAQIVGRDVMGAENRAGGSSLLFCHGQQQMFRADVGIVQLLGFGVRPVEHPLNFAAEAGLDPAPSLRGKPRNLPLHLLPDRGHVEAGFLEQRLHDTLILGEQRRQQMGVVDNRVAPGTRQLPCIAQGFLGLYGQSFWSDHRFLKYTGTHASSMGSGGWGIVRFNPIGAVARRIPADAAALAAIQGPWKAKRQPRGAASLLYLPRAIFFWAIILRVNR
jgi:hypothetical protein